MSRIAGRLRGQKDGYFASMPTTAVAEKYGIQDRLYLPTAWPFRSMKTLFMSCQASILVWIVSAPYVAQSWSVLEGSKETSGIQGIFLLKTMILVFATLLPLQGLALAARSVLTLAGVAPPPAPDDSPQDGV